MSTCTACSGSGTSGTASCYYCDGFGEVKIHPCRCCNRSRGKCFKCCGTGILLHKKVHKTKPPRQCTVCDGTGKQDGRRCTECLGAKKFHYLGNEELGVTLCYSCDGDGQFGDHKCFKCSGTGTMLHRKNPPHQERVRHYIVKENDAEIQELFFPDRKFAIDEKGKIHHCEEERSTWILQFNGDVIDQSYGGNHMLSIYKSEVDELLRISKLKSDESLKLWWRMFAARHLHVWWNDE